ncbi:MerR family transcriptional regulator [Micromonospora cathayae]|uniref:MerR family transcriptional regulator n=1 Tax=Micromonospora cathayae TaxID=3028804 RepID=A0ABY7ZRU4_9ACTN|nr:MerR family transcriptional regulator [Micromonospora sp. HUAS 3]WDZ85759.1 MerR family transcriptional regulator [Micromonospora sp. HUAS 3]
MLIGELSRRTGVGAYLLRYYEAQGLLQPGRSANGYREYTDEDILAVTQIRGLLEAGLSTEDIAYLQPCATGTAPDLEPCPELLTSLRARLHELDERIDTLTRSRRALHDYIDNTERRTSPQRRPCDATAPEPPGTAAVGGRRGRMPGDSARQAP